MRVSVIGGGVAGTAAAIALRQIGADVTVHEAYPDPGGPVGSFVSLAVNGLRGLDRLGLLERIQARGFAVPRQRLWSARGRLLAEVDRNRPAGDPLHSITLMRADLVAELRQAAQEAGVRVRTGDRLVAVTRTAAGIRATFRADQTEAGRDDADLLVGADGIGSTTRRLLDPAAPAPRYAGIYVVSGRSAGVPVEPGVFNLTFGRHGAFIHAAEPNGTVWWQAQVTDPTEPDRAGVEPEQWLDRLVGLYRERVPAQIIAATTVQYPTTVNQRLAPVSVWHDDTTVLIGDAVHPVGAGQGASLAIEDGLALAASIVDNSDLASALHGYEQSRRARVTEMLRASDDNRMAKQAGPVRRTVMSFGMRMFFSYFYPRATSWLYDYEPPKLTANT